MGFQLGKYLMCDIRLDILAIHFLSVKGKEHLGVMVQTFMTEQVFWAILVNYPLSKANGLPASQTSQPTISTGVNSGSPCPILLFLCYLS